MDKVKHYLFSMKVLLIFLDGIGLGLNDPEINPFALAKMPVIKILLGGQRLVVDSAPYNGPRASLLAIDACLGIEGLPQSATGQATLLTGKNIPKYLGYHYGPKPNRDISECVSNGNLFYTLVQNGLSSSFLNAYPPRYFESIESGRRIYAAIPLAATSAGIPLRTYDDLVQGKAISADFTAQGWKDHLGLQDTPVLSPTQAGMRLASLSESYSFSFFEYWLSDYAGHHQDMESSLTLLETFDQVLGGLISIWDDTDGLILITSDHGNMEDLSTRRHTYNTVPALLVGTPENRSEFTAGLKDLTDVAPAITKFLTNKP